MKIKFFEEAEKIGSVLDENPEYLGYSFILV